MNEHRIQWSDYIGRPYERGAEGPAAYDCYGLARVLARRRGYDLPPQDAPESIAMRLAMFAGRPHAYVVAVACPQPFDLVVFDQGRWGLHIGTLTDEPDRFLHANPMTGFVEIARLRHPLYAPSLAGFYRCTMRVSYGHDHDPIRRSAAHV